MRLVRGKYRRGLPAALTEASIVALLERDGECDAAQVAAALRMAEDTARTHLLVLERQGRVVARLETYDEARARIDALPRRAFVTRKARRRIRYTVTPSAQVAA